MKKGYIECPFCANEIKEGALKCQFCKEYLDKSNKIYTEAYQNIEQSKQYRPRYKNLGFWVIIGIISLIVGPTIYHKIRYANFQNVKNQYLDTLIENNGDISDIDLDKYIESTKDIYQNKEYQKAMDEISAIVVNYNNNINSLGDLFIEDNYDLKNVTKIKNVISDWKSYKLYSDQYLQQISQLFNKYKSQLGTTDTNTSYSINDVVTEISNLVKGIDRWADVNVELYTYILNVQDDFYVDDGSIFFYEGTYSMDKFNSLWNNRENESGIYDKVYEDYTTFMVDYAKQYRK